MIWTQCMEKQLALPFSSCFALFCHLEGTEPSSENQFLRLDALYAEWKHSSKLVDKTKELFCFY